MRQSATMKNNTFALLSSYQIIAIMFWRQAVTFILQIVTFSRLFIKVGIGSFYDDIVFPFGHCQGELAIKKIAKIGSCESVMSESWSFSPRNIEVSVCLSFVVEWAPVSNSFLLTAVPAHVSKQDWYLAEIFQANATGTKLRPLNIFWLVCFLR